jgi:hypothetical protein
MAPDYQRQSDRYELSGSNEHFKCSIIDDGSTTPIGVILNNVSVGGAQVTLPYRVLEGHEFKLQMGSERGVLETAACTVRWTVPGHDGWVCGCQFKTQLDNAFLDDLARVGVLERRDNLRFDIAVDCKVRVEGNPAEHAATLVDYSNGGVGMTIAGEIPIGRKALLQVDGPDGSPVRFFTHIQWCERGQRRYKAGLKFLRDADADAFLDCADALTEA